LDQTEQQAVLLSEPLVVRVFWAELQMVEQVVLLAARLAVAVVAVAVLWLLRGKE
jgi:hypothetical protein